MDEKGDRTRGRRTAHVGRDGATAFARRVLVAKTRRPCTSLPLRQRQSPARSLFEILNYVYATHRYSAMESQAESGGANRVCALRVPARAFLSSACECYYDGRYDYFNRKLDRSRKCFKRECCVCGSGLWRCGRYYQRRRWRRSRVQK